MADSVTLKLSIASEIYRACEALGADPDLLSIIGSYGDTLDDSDVLDALKHYNATGQSMVDHRGRH